jgi:hypothetical protein
MRPKPEGELVLAYLRALQSRLAAEEQVEGLVRVIHSAADVLKNWRNLTGDSISYPSGQQVSEALHRWRQARAEETAAWKALPPDLQDLLQRAPHTR